jgi:hypothetical protein
MMSSSSGLLCADGSNLTEEDKILFYRVTKNSVSLLTAVQNCKTLWNVRLHNLTEVVVGDAITISLWCDNATWLQLDADYVSGAFSAHAAVTINAEDESGLSIDANQVLSLPLATSAQSGALAFDDWTTFNGKANNTLNNLGSTAINTSLISDTDNTDDLGSSAVGWRMGYLRGLTLKGTSLTDLPTYSAEFLLDTGWTSADWAGSFAAGWSHPVGTIETISIGSGGSGYTALDVLTVVQTGGSLGTVRVDAVDGSGVILTCTRIDKGSGYAVASGLATTGGTGSAATINVLTINNATVLSQSKAAVNATKYQIAYTVTGRTAGSFTIAFGGQTISSLTATGAWGPTTSSTASLTITPTTTFNGTIVISIKSITAGSSPITQMLNSAGTLVNEVRTSNYSTNNFIGVGSGAYNTTGFSNNAQGDHALFSNTTGYYNTAQGVNALYSNTTGFSNVAQGYAALSFNTTGYYNSGQGTYSLYSNTTGFMNTAQGDHALFSNTTGAYNTAQGVNALYSFTGAFYNNIAIGYNAGRYYNGSTGNLTSIGNSVILGASASPLNGSGDTNEIVVGYNAIGAGSNTATLGNSSVTQINFGQGSLGKWFANYINLPTAKTPASAAAAGTAGDICWDSNAIYVCVSANTWKKAAIATW